MIEHITGSSKGKLRTGSGIINWLYRINRGAYEVIVRLFGFLYLGSKTGSDLNLDLQCPISLLHAIHS